MFYITWERGHQKSQHLGLKMARLRTLALHLQMRTVHLPLRTVEPRLVSGGVCLSFEDCWEKGQRPGNPGFPHRHWLGSFIYWCCVSGSRLPPILTGRQQHHQQQVRVWALGGSEILSHPSAAASGSSHKPLKSADPPWQ